MFTLSLVTLSLVTLRQHLPGMGESRDVIWARIGERKVECPLLDLEVGRLAVRTLGPEGPLRQKPGKGHIQLAERTAKA